MVKTNTQISTVGHYSANSNNSDSNEFNADNSAPFENEYQTEGGDQAAAGEYEDTAGRQS